MLSLITVSLLKQVFCFYKFSLHIEMVGVSGQERNKEKSGKQTQDYSRLRQGALFILFFTLIFPIAWKQVQSLRRPCQQQFLRIFALHEKGCSCHGQQFTSLWSNCLQEHGSDANPPVTLRHSISVGNSSVLLEGKKSVHFHIILSPQ